MQPILNVEDVRSVEGALVGQGVSTAELMYRAGNAVAQEVRRLEATSVVVLSGTGNNGGDGWVCAGALRRGGNVTVTIVVPVPVEELKSDVVRVVAGKAQQAGVHLLVGPSRSELESLVDGCDVVVDAMLGTGFHGVPQAPFDIWIDVVNCSGARVVAVDVPSGLSAQTGRAAGPCVVADVTITMLSLKPGLLADDGRDVCGSIVVAPLAAQTDQLVRDADPVAWRCEPSDYLDVLDVPTVSVDKFSRGSVLVVGGSTRYPGAAIMAARAASRAGAGYVTLAVPEPVVPVAQGHLLDVPVVGLPATLDGAFASVAREPLKKFAEKFDAVLVGPGMTSCSSAVSVCSGLLETTVPLVYDADALNCLAKLTSNQLDDFPELIRREAPLILTPHRRELGRLVGLVEFPPENLTAALEAARRIVWANGGSEFCVVAKGTATACVGVEGALVPKPGPVALATAGSGDVLAGIMAARLAHAARGEVDLPLLSALACEIHGAAGALASERFGSSGVVATDILDVVGLAVDAVEGRIAYAADAGAVSGDDAEE